MSMTMTLRRASPSDLEQIPEDQIALFAMGIENGGFVNSDDAIVEFYDWHVVQYLSARSAWDEKLPAGFMVGGSNWCEIDPDHEPTKILTVDEVASINDHLKLLDASAISGRCSEILGGDTGIYAGEISNEMVPIWKNAYSKICEFFAQAAQNQQAVVKSIT